MTRKLLVGAIAAGAFAITAGTALALTGNDSTTPTPGAVATTSTTSTTPTAPTTSGTDPSTTSDPATPSTSTDATPPNGAETLTVTAADARRIVQARYGGTVREVERETEHGRIEWDVEIDAADGNHYEIRIDAHSGAITRVEQDDRDDNSGSGGDRDDRDDDGGDDHGGDRDDDGDDDDRHGDDD